MVLVKKIFGEIPVNVVVLSETVIFDEEGIAEVSEEVADVLAQIPHQYVIVDEHAEAQRAEALQKAEELQKAKEAEELQKAEEAEELRKAEEAKNAEDLQNAANTDPAGAPAAPAVTDPAGAPAVTDPAGAPAAPARRRPAPSTK